MNNPLFYKTLQLALAMFISVICSHAFSLTSPAPGIVVEYRNAADSSNVMIKPDIKLINTSTKAISLQDYTLRYWYTNETAPSEQQVSIFFVLNDANWQSPCYYPYNCISRQFTNQNGQQYLELGFSPAAGLLQPGRSLSIQFGIHAANWQAYTQENDYSYGAPNPNYQAWQKISVYRSQQLVYGSEPVVSPPCLEEAPQILARSMTPSVIDILATTPIEFRVRIPGPVTTASICLAPSPSASCSQTLVLQGPNAQCEYKTELTTAQITQFFNAETDVQHAVYGFLDVANMNTRVNLIANVITPQIPRCNSSQISANVQTCEYVVNLALPELFQDANNLTVSKRKQVSQALYQWFEDDYDFLNIVSVSHSFIQNRSFASVSNAVSGIGTHPHDDSAQYGSLGKLKGTVVYPNSTYFDGAAFSSSHELAHNWINFLRLPILSQASPHWPISDLANSIVGYSQRNGQGLQFNKKLVIVDGVVQTITDSAPKKFSDLDLYLMGLLPSDEVAEHFVMDDATDPNNFPSANYQVFSINDVIAVDGHRYPAYPYAQTEFRVATVLVSDQLLDSSAISFFNYFAARIADKSDTLLVREGLASPAFQHPFYAATGGRGTIDARVQPTAQ